MNHALWHVHSCRHHSLSEKQTLHTDNLASSNGTETIHVLVRPCSLVPASCLHATSLWICPSDLKTTENCVSTNWYMIMAEFKVWTLAANWCTLVSSKELPHDCKNQSCYVQYKMTIDNIAVHDIGWWSIMYGLAPTINLVKNMEERIALTQPDSLRIAMQTTNHHTPVDTAICSWRRVGAANSIGCRSAPENTHSMAQKRQTAWAYKPPNACGNTPKCCWQRICSVLDAECTT